MNIQQEGRLKFWRYECTEGFIDRWTGDAHDDPNNVDPPQLCINASAVWYRLNGKGEWLPSHSFSRNMTSLIQEYCETFSAIDIWNTFLNK